MCTWGNEWASTFLKVQIPSLASFPPTRFSLRIIVHTSKSQTIKLGVACSGLWGGMTPYHDRAGGFICFLVELWGWRGASLQPALGRSHWVSRSRSIGLFGSHLVIGLIKRRGGGGGDDQSWLFTMGSQERGDGGGGWDEFKPSSPHCVPSPYLHSQPATASNRPLWGSLIISSDHPGRGFLSSLHPILIWRGTFHPPLHLSQEGF
jgi:hypothetical protein